MTQQGIVVKTVEKEMSDLIKNLPEFIDFREKVTVPERQNPLKMSNLDLVYMRTNKYVAVIGVITLEDFARFTSDEEKKNDRIEFAGEERLYLTGLKRRAVYQRVAEGILRNFLKAHGLDLVCATPDRKCGTCYICYTYGGLVANKNDDNKSQGWPSRIKPITAFSLQNTDTALMEDEEFHNMVHRDMQMEKDDASVYGTELIKPGTMFPFIDIIFEPTQFDLAMYFETMEYAQKAGFGSMATRLGTFSVDYLGLTDSLCFGNRHLLKSIQIYNGKPIWSLPDNILTGQNLTKAIDSLRKQLPALIEKHKGSITSRLDMSQHLFAKSIDSNSSKKKQEKRTANKQEKNE